MIGTIMIVTCAVLLVALIALGWVSISVPDEVREARFAASLPSISDKDLKYIALEIKGARGINVHNLSMKICNELIARRARDVVDALYAINKQKSAEMFVSQLFADNYSKRDDHEVWARTKALLRESVPEMYQYADKLERQLAAFV